MLWYKWNVRKFKTDLTNSLTTNVPHNIEASQLISHVRWDGYGSNLLMDSPVIRLIGFCL